MTQHTKTGHTGTAFESLRPHALRIAYRVLGTLTEAEDVVQEAWLRWHKTQTSEIRSPKAWITTVVTRLAIDQLRAAKARREAYPGPWLPTPIIEFEDMPDERTPSPEDTVALADDVSLALLMVLEHLGPEERAAFILREAFDTDYAEIARILGKSEAACRQIVSRAGKRIREGQPRFARTPRAHAMLQDVFRRALQTGDASAFRDLCTVDAVLLSDGGGKVAAALNPIHGQDRIARFFEGIARRWREGRASDAGDSGPLDFYAARINGLAGLVVFAGSSVNMTVAFEMDEAGRMAMLYMMRNPDKLNHIGRPAGAPLYSVLPG